MQENSLPAEPQGKSKNTGVGSLSLLQRIFPTQELNQGLLHCRQIHYQLSSLGSPNKQINIFKIEREYLQRQPQGNSSKISTNDASLVAQLIKNPPAMLETWVRSLGWVDLQRREWLPIPVFWPGEIRDCIVHGDHKELDMTE